MKGLTILRWLCGETSCMISISIPRYYLNESQALSFAETLLRRMRRFKLKYLYNNDPNYWVYVGNVEEFTPKAIQALGIRIDKLYKEFIKS